MSQNQENIEAKLCAYIDDELDAEGRAELEKHLLANPQHQRLIEELRRTSGLVRNLPRESAPADLAEGFHAQMERSVLLEGVSEDVVAASLRTPRWPQLVAMAAITLLTAGLAMVVYFSLPPTGARPKVQLAQSTPSGPNKNLNGPMLASASATDRDRDRDLGKVRDGQVQAEDGLKQPQVASSDTAAPVVPPASTAVALNNGGATAGSASPSSLDAFANAAEHQKAAIQSAGERSDLRKTGSVLADATDSPNPAPLLVIHTDQPAELRKELVLYLVQQNISWEPANSAALEFKRISPQVPSGSNIANGNLQNGQDALGLSNRFADRSISNSDLKRDANGVKDQANGALNLGPATQPTTQSVASASSAADKARVGGSVTGQTSYREAANGESPQVAQAPVSPSQVSPSQVLQSQVLQSQNSPSPVSPSQVSQSQVARSQFLRATQTPDFAVVCQLTPSQVESLRTAMQRPGTIVDPSPTVQAESSKESALQLANASGKKGLATPEDATGVSAVGGAFQPTTAPSASTGGVAENVVPAVPANLSLAAAPTTNPAADESLTTLVIDVQQSLPTEISPVPQAVPTTQPADTVFEPVGAVVPSTQPATQP